MYKLVEETLYAHSVGTRFLVPRVSSLWKAAEKSVKNKASSAAYMSTIL